MKTPSLLFHPIYCCLVACQLFFLVIVMTSTARAEIRIFENQRADATLIEVFTSEGCSSCPPADKWLSRFIDDPRLWQQIFPIAFHVDYWDYLGWRDRFASPRFTKRQRLYNQFGHSRNVATPGFIVAGKGWNGWFRGQSLPEATKKQSSGLIHAQLDGSHVEIKFSPATEINNKLKAHVAILGFGLVNSVKGGENKGHELTHDFVALAYESKLLAKVTGHWQVTIDQPGTANFVSKKQAAVIWVSEEDDPRPLQVSGGWL